MKSVNQDSAYLCHCKQITVARFDQLLEESPCPNYYEFKAKYGLGSVCSACEFEAKGEIAEYLLAHPEKKNVVAAPPGAPRLSDRIRGTIKHWRLKLHRLRRGPRRPVRLFNDYVTGVFFMRDRGLESRLVVSNLPFPEHETNANGPEVTFRATLYGTNGERLGVADAIHLPSGVTAEYTPAELFPEVTSPFTGGLYIEFPSLRQTGSLRPYGLLTSAEDGVRARCHYHDKFGLFLDPGYFMNTSPFEPGEQCWMGASNCQEKAYESVACAQFGSRVLRAPFKLPPMASRWLRVDSLFPELAEIPPAERSPAVFWLESPQHFMLYFFWFDENSRTWMGQHH